MMISLDRIITGINQKDEKSWELLYRACYAALCTYAESFVHDFDNAKDLAQETLVDVWVSDLRFPSSKELLSYLYKSLYHKSLTFLRNQKRRNGILDRIKEREMENEDYEQEAFLLRTVQEEVIRQLYAYVRDLPLMRRKVIEFSIGGLSNKEIANYLDISVNTVKVQKNKSLKFLRERLVNVRVEYKLSF